MIHRDDGKDPRERPEAEQSEGEGRPEGEEADQAAQGEAEADADLALLERAQELEGKVQELEDARLRLLAELENTRRRAARDVEEAGKYAVTKFARDMLEVLDNLGRALEAVPEHEIERSEPIKRLVEGVAMTQKSLLAVLERHQIHPVEPEPGERFDHNRHQAMFEAETSEHPPGTVATVMQKGYTISDRLLRPALVGVAKPPPEKPESGDGEAAGASEAERSGREAPPGSRLDTTA